MPSVATKQAIVTVFILRLEEVQYLCYKKKTGKMKQKQELSTWVSKNRMKDTQGKTATSIDSKCLQMQNSNEKLIASA